MTDKMTFEAWVAQATEQELREASDFRHHYPQEIKTLTVSFEELTERGIEEIRDDKDAWKTITVCGCDPAFQEEYGSEGHEPSTPIAMDFEDFERQLGLMD